MAHDSQDFASPQEAIEGYLEALLQDVAAYDEPTEEKQAEDIADASGPESVPANKAASAPGTKETHPVQPEKETEDSAPLSDDEGIRIFAPPSARDYAREAAAQVRRRRAAAQPAPETALQDKPTVVMPELKVAEPEISVKTETVIETDTETQSTEPETQTVTPEPETETVSAEPVTETLSEAASTETVVEDTEQQVQENEGWSNGRPDWAQGRFECLLFDVKGLKLAVPLAELGGIHKLEKEPTPLFGQPGWFLGIVRTNNMNVGLVDTAQWVMSEHISDDHRPDFRFAIRIHNSEWGLACHEVAEAISLDPDEVKWRTTLGKRPWLAGTVVDHMCALIDVAAFARLLDSDKVPVDLQALMADEE